MFKSTLKYLLLIGLLLGVSQGALISQQSTARAAIHADIKLELSVYPNPAQDFFSLKSNHKIGKVSVHNIIGKEIMSYTSTTDNRYAINDLEKGLYVVRIFSKSGDMIKALRLSKS